ncbi:MAG: hypothetical protein KDE27_28395 [Planctomycetes bacterium]|nr:hypothetical protein [Planctomycetota bacterium]
MRVGCWLGLGLLGACSSASGPSGENTLVLELGGEHGSLRRALLAAGVVVAPRTAAVATPPRSIASMLGSEAIAVPPEPAAVAGAAGSEAGPDSSATPPATEQPPTTAVPGREVELQPGQTISHLASRHLGTVRRYREILELNGWSEAESRRLAPGTKVKLPPE